MNRGKEVIVEAKLWIVFKQGGHDIEFLLSVPAYIGNKAICGLGWGREQKITRIDRVGLSTEENERADQQGVKRQINVTKILYESGRQEIANLPNHVGYAIPLNSSYPPRKRIRGADFNLIQVLEFKSVIGMLDD